MPSRDACTTLPKGGHQLAAGRIEDGGSRIEQSRQALPGRLRQGVAMNIRLHGGDESELEDKAVVVGRQLAIETVVECVRG